MNGRYNSDRSTDGQQRRRAAMYVRMSTNHQKYSTENQADAIRDYAEHRQIDIIKTYADSGKSGLNLDGRDPLQHLIADVQSGSAEYNVLLLFVQLAEGGFTDNVSFFVNVVFPNPGTYWIQTIANTVVLDELPLIVTDQANAQAMTPPEELSETIN